MLRPAPEDSPDLTDARWDMILKCWSAKVSRPSASMAIDFLKSELEALSGDHTTLFREERSHRQAPSDMLGTAQRTASSDAMHPTHEGGLRPPSLVSPNITTPQPSFRVMPSLPLDPLNVLLFGETGVDKSSIIKLIVGKNISEAAPDASYSMLKRTAEVTLGERRFGLWDVSSSPALMGIFRPFAKWRLRASYKKLHRDGGAPLLLYCMKGTSAPTASREYQDFTDIVGSTSCVSIAAVVNGLEESLTNMDDWWTKYVGDLKLLGMQFSNHVCITSLSNDPNALRSRETICSLIESYASYVPLDTHHRRRPLVPL